MLQEFLEIEELKSIHEEKLRLMEREMALSTPLLTELEYIPMLYKWYCELSGCCEESGGLNAHQKGQFLLIILFFYSPITLVGGRIVNGVRTGWQNYSVLIPRLLFPIFAMLFRFMRLTKAIERLLISCVTNL